jgi:hypothetical protein
MGQSWMLANWQHSIKYSGPSEFPAPVSYGETDTAVGYLRK